MILSVILQLSFNSMTLMLLVPIALELERAYNLTSAFPVNMCAIGFSLATVPMSFVAISAFNNFSVRTVLGASVTLQLIGAWTRSYAFVAGEFWPILVGTSIIALSQAIV
jgi:hypothetical protein